MKSIGATNLCATVFGHCISSLFLVFNKHLSDIHWICVKLNKIRNYIYARGLLDKNAADRNTHMFPPTITVFLGKLMFDFLLKLFGCALSNQALQTACLNKAMYAGIVWRQIIWIELNELDKHMTAWHYK